MSEETIPSTESPKFHKSLHTRSTKTHLSGLKSLIECKTFTIYGCFDSKISMISIDLPMNILVSRAIVLIIQEFNKQNKGLAEDNECYALHFAKKNGEPKDDLPGIYIGFYLIFININIAISEELTFGDLGVCKLVLKERNENKQLGSRRSSMNSLKSSKSIKTAESTYQSPLLNNKMPINQEKKEKELEKKKSFWSFFLCHC